jgi:RNA polymerase-binding transcription factor DksA
MFGYRPVEFKQDLDTKIAVHELGHALIAWLNQNEAQGRVIRRITTEDTHPDYPYPHVDRANKYNDDEDDIGITLINRVFYYGSAANTVNCYNLQDPTKELDRVETDSFGGCESTGKTYAKDIADFKSTMTSYQNRLKRELDEPDLPAERRSRIANFLTWDTETDLVPLAYQTCIDALKAIPREKLYALTEDMKQRKTMEDPQQISMMFNQHIGPAQDHPEALACLARFVEKVTTKTPAGENLLHPPAPKAKTLLQQIRQWFHQLYLKLQNGVKSIFYQKKI